MYAIVIKKQQKTAQRRLRLIVVIAISAIVIGACSSNGGDFVEGGSGETFTRSSYSNWDKWPWKADEVTLKCRCGHLVYAEVGSVRYALNGTAQTHLNKYMTNVRNYQAGTVTPGDGRLHYDLGQFLDAGLDQCRPRDQEGGRLDQILAALQECPRS